MPKTRSNQIKIMLDSGAFSAWGRGEVLDLNDYIQFIKRYQKLLDTYINLDVIPGERGTRASVREVERAAAVSLDNYRSMRAAGLDPIPVFHYGESFGWLDKLLESGAKYICLGGTVGLKTPVKRRFLDECWTALTDRAGRPLVRVHGLGVTEGQFLMRYPWHSADSTSWCIAPIYGMILVPGMIAGSFSAQIYLGGGNLGDDKAGRRFERLPASAQEHVLKFAAECGFTITDLRNDVYARMAVFVRCLLVAQAQMGDRFRYRRGGFGAPPTRDLRPVTSNFRMIFAGNVSSNPYLQGVLRGAGVEHTLRSYYEHLRDPDSFAGYVECLNAETAYRTAQRKMPRVDWKSMNYHDHRRRQLAARGTGEDEEYGAETTT